MNTLWKVLVGAALVLGLAGLVVGLSHGGSNSSPANLSASQPHNWTNFASSYVSTKSGYAMTNSDDSGFVPWLLSEGYAGITALYPTALFGDFVWSANGYSQTFSTSSALTAAQFCATSNQEWLSSGAAVETSTLPAATSTWVACGSPALGAINTNFISNEGTSSVNVVAGTGMTFMCETQGVGTTTLATGVQCTSSQVTVNANSNVEVQGFWNTASSSMQIMWGNEYH